MSYNKISNFNNPSYITYLKSILSNHPKFPVKKIEDKTGIILINTGTPKSYGYWDLRRYLKEFLTDQRVIEVNKFIWPFKKAKCYKSIWNEELNESPLLTMSRSQGDKVYHKLINSNIDGNFVVDWAFRYGSHNIEERINYLVKSGCNKLIFLPLFPQYSQATVGGACDEIYRVMCKLRYQPPIRIIPPYYRNEKYIKSIGDSILKKLEANEKELEVLIFSYHGIPLKYSVKGDIYNYHCHETTDLIVKYIKKSVELNNDKYNSIPEVITSFSSRLGPMEWLKPYTDDVVTNLGKTGCKSLGIISPSFHTDCLETWEELRDDLGDLFRKLSNNGNFVFINSLNDSNDSINVISNLIIDNYF